MIQFLSSLFNTLFSFLSGVLPDSPFADLATVTDGMATGIGYLNWFFPVGQALALFTAWLAACVIVVAAKFVGKRVTGSANTLTNVAGGSAG